MSFWGSLLSGAGESVLGKFASGGLGQTLIGGALGAGLSKLSGGSARSGALLGAGLGLGNYASSGLMDGGQFGDFGTTLVGKGWNGLFGQAGAKMHPNQTITQHKIGTSSFPSGATQATRPLYNSYGNMGLVQRVGGNNAVGTYGQNIDFTKGFSGLDYYGPQIQQGAEQAVKQGGSQGGFGSTLMGIANIGSAWNQSRARREQKSAQRDQAYQSMLEWQANRPYEVKQAEQAIEANRLAIEQAQKAMAREDIAQEAFSGAPTLVQDPVSGEWVKNPALNNASSAFSTALAQYQQ